MGRKHKYVLQEREKVVLFVDKNSLNGADITRLESLGIVVVERAPGRSFDLTYVTIPKEN